MLNDALNNLELASTGPIGLVNDDHIRELDLIDQEVSDTPLVVLDRTDVAVGEPIARPELAQDCLGIDDSHHRVEIGHITEREAVFVAKSERRRDRHRLTDTG